MEVVVFNLREDQVGSEEGNRIMETEFSSRESVNCVRRKVLADISNLPHQPKQADLAAKSSFILLRDKEHMEKLQKENVVLTKALADRKIIELSALELQKLRTNMRKVHKKNLELAQANTQMLRELNSGKDMIKVLKHELDCKNCLLKVRQLELKEKAKPGACHFNQNELIVAQLRDETAKQDDAGESSQAGQPCNTRQRRQRTNLSGSSTSAELVQADENANKKRPCRRRQSARFRPDVAESCLNVLEMGDSKANVLNGCLELLKENHPAPPSSSMERGHEEKNVATLENQAHSRSSVGRPLRRAAGKVQSYKEVPVNVKMRRPDVVTFPNEKMYVAPSSTAERVQPEENVNKKRPCQRRQSDRFRSDVTESCSDLLEMGDSKSNVLNACVELLEENHPASLSSFTEKEDQEENVAKAEKQPHLRSSIGRPSRRAAQKAPSYKEVPLNVKMRREV